MVESGATQKSNRVSRFDLAVAHEVNLTNPWQPFSHQQPDATINDRTSSVHEHNFTSQHRHIILLSRLRYVHLCNHLNNLRRRAAYSANKNATFDLSVIDLDATVSCRHWTCLDVHLNWR